MIVATSKNSLKIMKESRFIKNNINKWRTLEKTLTAKQFLKNPEKASQDFLDINDDQDIVNTLINKTKIQLSSVILARRYNLHVFSWPFLKSPPVPLCYLLFVAPYSLKRRFDTFSETVMFAKFAKN